MHDNKGKKEEDCKHANNDVNKARFKLFKKLHLQMFHEETKALKVFVSLKDAHNMFLEKSADID